MWRTRCADNGKEVLFIKLVDLKKAYDLFLGMLLGKCDVSMGLKWSSARLYNGTTLFNV